MADDLQGGAAAEQLPLTFDVYSVDEDTEEETRIGKVEYGPGGMLAVLEATPEQEQYLYTTVDAINKKDVMVEKLPPGPDAPRYGLSARAVARTDKDFLPVLQHYLRNYYGLSLG